MQKITGRHLPASSGQKDDRQHFSRSFRKPADTRLLPELAAKVHIIGGFSARQHPDGLHTLPFQQKRSATQAPHIRLCGLLRLRFLSLRGRTRLPPCMITNLLPGPSHNIQSTLYPVTSSFGLLPRVSTSFQRTSTVFFSPGRRAK